MATMITAECINCGACEPECPNNAISQDEAIYVIDPLLCTECVGFHDFEACASVCPADCCVTDPNNIETEAALIARAKDLHQEVDFGEHFESRFRSKEDGAGAPAAAKTPSQPAPAEVKAAAKSEPKNGAPHQAVAPAIPLASQERAPAQAAPLPEKRFPGQLSESFDSVWSRLAGSKAVGGGLLRWAIFVLQPILGAMPSRARNELEKSVNAPFFFSDVRAAGLNLALDMLFYPLLMIGAATAFHGPAILFARGINLYIFGGLFLGLLEAIVRLREAIFNARPVEAVRLGGAPYGIVVSVGLNGLLSGRTGIMRRSSVPVDGFYGKGFVEKLERERRYGNVYTIEDWGNAYFLRLEFPRRVPEIGIPLRSGLPDEMPDYDYDLVLRDGQFIVKGRCADAGVRRLASNVGAFPMEFVTTIPLPETVEGFAQRRRDKVLEVLLLKAGYDAKGEMYSPARTLQEI